MMGPTKLSLIRARLRELSEISEKQVADSKESGDAVAESLRLFCEALQIEAKRKYRRRLPRQNVGSKN